jgi:hypothetical protein
MLRVILMKYSKKIIFNPKFKLLFFLIYFYFKDKIEISPKKIVIVV